MGSKWVTISGTQIDSSSLGYKTRDLASTASPPPHGLGRPGLHPFAMPASLFVSHNLTQTNHHNSQIITNHYTSPKYKSLQIITNHNPLFESLFCCNPSILTEKAVTRDRGRMDPYLAHGILGRNGSGCLERTQKNVDPRNLHLKDIYIYM